MTLKLHKIRFLMGIIFALLTSIFACKKLVEVGPPVTQSSSETIYKNNATAAAVLTGIYEQLNEGSNKFAFQNTLLSGLLADEFTLYYSNNINLSQAYKNILQSNNAPFWVELYSYIYTTNAAIEGLDKSLTITPDVKQQLTGEAKFLRGFFYFYLVNLFGDVPVLTTTNYKANALAGRISKDEVYRQIILDLTEAEKLLSSDYKAADAQSSTTERIRPSKAAAQALLARAYLYSGAYDSSEIWASKVINNSLYTLDSLNDVFLKNSKETIWQLQPVNTGYNTFDGFIFVLLSKPNALRPVALSPSLENAFEPGDERQQKWTGEKTVNGITYLFSYKYKLGYTGPSVVPNEYLTVLRLAEQYLIRAEARAYEGKFDDAIDDLNSIRFRAGLQATTANDKLSLVSSIIHERQVELFAEWGHRWLDLKRTQQVDSVIGSQKPTWTPTAKLLPIPSADIQTDPNLKQNPGYE